VNRSLRSRPIAVLALGGLSSLGALLAADLLTAQSAVRVDGFWDSGIFRNFGPYRKESRTRGGHEGSQILLQGLRAAAPVVVTLEMASRGGDQRVRIRANGKAVHETRPDDAGPIHFSTDEQGSLSLRFEGVRRQGVSLRVSSVGVRQEAGGTIPLRRLVHYGLIGVVGASLAMRIRSPRPALGITLAVVVLLCAGVSLARLHVLAYLPWGLLAFGLLAGWLLLSDLCAKVTSIPLAYSRWVVLSLLFRVGLILQPGFESVDAGFHVHRIWRFQSHALISSDAPGIEAVPYPPAFYAVLAPWIRGDAESDERLLRLVMGLLEGTSPLLVFALMRAGGATREASGAAAVTSALMPEGTLVLAKGIACNIFGSFVGLALLIGLVRNASAVTTTALLTLVLLSHAPAAFTVTMLLLLWWGLEWQRGTLGPGALKARLLSLGIAAALAWTVYYREVSLVLANPGGSTADSGFLYVRWYRVGKILQDLLLKFGLVPLVWATWGLARADVPLALKGLLVPWFLVGLGLAALAVGSPFPLRFEYFLTPAVAMAAGLGVERLRGEGAGGWVQAGWAFTALVQVVVGILLLLQSFEIISVIMESRRWPFPVRF
jgi:hypothetical protein